MNDYDFRNHLDMVPEHMRQAITSWIVSPVHPTLLGAFMRALLTNDLKGAFAHADSENALAMHSWVKFLYNHAPGPCWGSPANVAAWHERHVEATKARVGAP